MQVQMYGLETGGESGLGLRIDGFVVLDDQLTEK